MGGSEKTIEVHNNYYGSVAVQIINSPTCAYTLTPDFIYETWRNFSLR